jgi:hypothetical protein
MNSITRTELWEKNLGVHLNGYYCSEEEFLESTDSLLNDKELAQILWKYQKEYNLLKVM